MISKCQHNSFSIYFLSDDWFQLLLLLSHFSRVRLCATPQMAAHQDAPSRPWDSPGKNTGVSCYYLLQVSTAKSFISLVRDPFLYFDKYILPCHSPVTAVCNNCLKITCTEFTRVVTGNGNSNPTVFPREEPIFSLGFR